LSAWALGVAVGERLGTRAARVALGSGVLAFSLLLIASFAGWQTMLSGYPPFGYFVAPLLERDRPVMVFSMSVDYVYAPLRKRSRLVGPWTVHFTLPALLELTPESVREEALRDYAAELGRDIDEGRPDLLVFAPYRQALPPGRELHEILSGLGVVPRADYERVPALALGTDPRLRDWIVYRRRGTT
jgi:hypothetical protein